MFKSNKNIRKFFPYILLTIISFSIFFGTGFSHSQDIKNNDVLKFVHLSDVHLDSNGKDNSRRLYADSRKLLQDAINQINNFKDIDFVVFSGDSINKPSEYDLIKFIATVNKLEFPWYLSTGNHEIGIKGGLSKIKRMNIISKYNKNINTAKSYYSFSPKKGYLVIVMDGVIDSRVTANGHYNKEELKWLENQLCINKNSKVIIVQHFPVVEPYKSESHYITNLAEYRQVLNKYNNVIAVLSGHYHAAKITKLGNITYVSTPALVEYPNAYRVITISNKNGKTEVNFDFKETRLKYLQQKSKDRSKSWQLNQGKDNDRNTTIILDGK